VPLKTLPAKLQIPLPSPKTLYRAHLADRLAAALRAPVTLIAAEAGFGKSTLVASFLSRDGRPAVWYRLDATDSDPSVFAAHVLQGLRPFVPRQAHASSVSGLSHTTDWIVVSQLLALTMSRLRGDIVIVLDDFHVLDAPSLPRGMTRLVEALPARAHLVLLSRTRPPLPLQRWQVEGRLTELGTNDLRFTAGELRALLVDLHRLPLTETTLHLISVRTEGWPAGVVLALHAATAQGPQEAARALSQLSGSTREIYDYLAQEAYTRQDPATRRFLLASAVVSQFGVPLVEALLEDSAMDARAILDELERTHLFIVPLDNERRWYRYHHLFQEFLRRIGTDHDGPWIRDIHRRAAAWWERHGEVGETMEHLLAAGEAEPAAQLLGATGIDLVSRGRIETVQRWLAAIPERAWPSVPRLYHIRGLTQIISGASREAVRSFREAQRLLRATGDGAGDALALRWLVQAAAWEGEIDLLSGLLPEMAETEARLPPDAAVSRGHVHAAIGRIALWTGDLATAETRCRSAMAAASSTNDLYARIWCARAMAELLETTGRFHEAVAIYEDLTARARAHQWWHEAAHLHAELAEVLLAIGRDDQAEHHLGEAGLLQATIPCLVLQAELAVVAALAAARRGARDRAEARLREVRGPGEGATRYRLWRFLATVDLSFLLAESDPVEASQLAGEAVEQAHRFGLLRQGRALLAAGLAARSHGPFLTAAATLARAGAYHFQALSLLHAASCAPPEQAAAVDAQTHAVLRNLTQEGWEFLRAQAPSVLLTRYRGDPALAAQLPSGVRESPPAAKLALWCLGPFAIVRDGTVLDRSVWPRAAPRRLLQFLLLHDRPVHREEIIEHLWPDADPRNGANQLRVALTHLRRVLEPDRPPGHPSRLLVSSASTVAVAREHIDVDLDRFRRALAKAASAEGDARVRALEEAVAVYRGPLLEDAPYEEWAQSTRDRLVQQYAAALGRLAEMNEAEGQLPLALSRWQAVLETDPFAEHAHRGVIRCALALGRAADALRAFTQCVRTLNEIGAAPSAETLALEPLISGLPRGSPR
jgi:LuxR family maltose regulon positive regulatory protein